MAMDTSVDIEVRTEIPARGEPTLRPQPAPVDPQALARLKAATPARLGTGRAGTRYRTASYLELRADHAIALDAVESEVPSGWAEGLGYVPLASRADSHLVHLLEPDRGRRLSEASVARCAAEASRGVDLQLIAGDGLSATALMENGPKLLAALEKALTGAGFTVGRPLFVKYARVGVQDEVGVLTGARATVMLVGERPGLGTGDSLSIYTAYGPKLGQDNSEKDCISNVRPDGLSPEEAARRCAELMRRTFEAGGGGVRLVARAASESRH